MGLSQTVQYTKQYHHFQWHFFPVISLDEIRDVVRIDGAVTDVRLRQLVLEEIIDVNRLLASLVMKADTLADLSTIRLMVNQIPKFFIFQQYLMV
jgi:DNA mismatch repair ATPase MutS